MRVRPRSSDAPCVREADSDEKVGPILHPYAILRLAGLPAGLARFSDGEFVNALALEAAARQAFEAARESTCQRLAHLLPETYARSQQAGRVLLQLKRDLFNGRGAAAEALEGLPADLAAEVEQLSALIRDLTENAGLCRSAYDAELERAFRRVEGAARHPNLLSAIEATNGALHRKLGRLARGALPPKELNATRRSLARYVLRSTRKTSPLSSFGVVALAGWSDRAAGPDPLAAVPGGFERRRAPRAAALEYIFDRLLASIDRIDPATRVRLNSSLVKTDAGYEWLKAEADDPPGARTRGVRLTRMSSEATLVRVLETLFAAGDRLPIGAIRAFLVGRLGAKSDARVDALLKAAWLQGLIQPDLPSRDLISTWWESACACLSEPLRGRVANCARDFIAAVTLPERDPPEAEQAFAALLEAAGIDVAVAEFRPLAFEDCVIPPGRVTVPRPALDPFLPDLATYLRLTRLLSLDSPLSRLRRRMTVAFVERFGPGGVCADPHDFLEAIWPDMEAGSAAGAQDPGSRSPAEAEALREALVDFLAGHAAAGDIVRLRSGDLDAFVARMPAWLRAQPISAIAFGQPFEDSDGQGLVLNRVYPGTSRMVSRFLSPDDGSADKVAHYVRMAAPHGRPVELPGVFGFNANSHPELAAEILDIPPFASPSGRRKLELSRLRLRHRPVERDLAWSDEEGREMDLVYLGIVSPLWLPRLHQLLYAVSFGSDRSDGLWPYLFGKRGFGSDGILSLPRIQIGGLVIVRAMSAVRPEVLPDARLEPALFFRRFLAWAEGRLLQRHLYFQHADLAGEPAPAPAADQGKRTRAAASKPMPLDRHCPLSVLLFQRSLAARHSSVLFSEALPGPDSSSFTLGGEPVAGEVGIELTLSA